MKHNYFDNENARLYAEIVKDERLREIIETYLKMNDHYKIVMAGVVEMAYQQYLYNNLPQSLE